MRRLWQAMTTRPFSEFADRNGAPIQDVLIDEFANCQSVLEIGSGTGQHAMRFATAMPYLTWQCSDLEKHHAGLRALVADSEIKNLLPPLALDVRTADPPAQSYDAAFSANTAHIMSIDAVEKLFALVGAALSANGLFCLYGPFRRAGQFNTKSNATFHHYLRGRDVAMGIRHLEALDEFAARSGLARVRLYAMPANNHIAVWRKGNA
jgi:SAM-dependent methyltransferase